MLSDHLEHWPSGCGGGRTSWQPRWYPISGRRCTRATRWPRPVLGGQRREFGYKGVHGARFSDRSDLQLSADAAPGPGAVPTRTTIELALEWTMRSQALAQMVRTLWNFA